MKKIDNTALKHLLNLKEDYTLDLNKNKEDDIILEDEKNDKASEEANDSSTEEIDTDKEDKSTEDDKKTDETPEENKPQGTQTNTTKEKNEFAVSMSDIYQEMEDAKSPSSVAFVLKKFLDRVENSSLEALSKIKD